MTIEHSFIPDRVFILKIEFIRSDSRSVEEIITKIEMFIKCAITQKKNRICCSIGSDFFDRIYGTRVKSDNFRIVKCGQIKINR